MLAIKNGFLLCTEQNTVLEVECGNLRLAEAYSHEKKLNYLQYTKI